MKLDTDLTSPIKINSTCIENLNVRAKTVKLLEENVVENLYALDLTVISWI